MIVGLPVGVIITSAVYASSCAVMRPTSSMWALNAIVSSVPSGEITNLPFLRQVGGFGKPVLLSTGMATTPEIRAALQALALSVVSRVG